MLRKFVGLIVLVGAFAMQPFALYAQGPTSSTKRATKANSDAYSVLYDFDGPPNGAFPYGSLIQSSDGNYYGVTSGGGANTPEECEGEEGCGTAFKMTPTGSVTVLYSFCSQINCKDGWDPLSLVEASDGNFYGVTLLGGASTAKCPNTFSGCGTVFKLSPSGILTTLYTFCDTTNCTDGEEPNPGLIQGSDGNFYGTTQEGGANQPSECSNGAFTGCGTVFKITPSGDLTTLYSFCGMTNCTDGAGPSGALVQGSDGSFYSTTGTGGANNYGTIFKVTSTGALTTLYSFCSQSKCLDGGFPYAALVEGSDSSFYGTAFEGGANTDNCTGDVGCGTIFKVSSSGEITTIHSFCNQADCPDGAVPFNGLFLASDGNFYGTTVEGGTHASSCVDSECGTIFSVSSSGSFAVLYSFCAETSCADGEYIDGEPVIQGSDGSFYGGTSGGGTNDYGIVYQLSPSPALSGPAQITLSASSVDLGNSVTLDWSVLNAFSTTMQQCYAFVQGGATGAGTWTGLQTGALSSGVYQGSATIMPTATGTYTYALTCGGIESGFATLTVDASTTPDIEFTSVTHNMGSVVIGNSTAYGVQLTNNTNSTFPFALTLTSVASPDPFSYATNCGTSVAGGAKCEILFSYAPKSGDSGTQTATWSLAAHSFTFGPSNGGTLTGTVSGTAHLTVTTNGHNYGDVTEGTASPLYGVVLTNATADNVNMTYALGDTTDFTVATNCPALLGAGVSCNLQYTFKPESAGFLSTTDALTATDAKTEAPVTIYVNGTSTPVTGIALKGTGVAP